MKSQKDKKPVLSITEYPSVFDNLENMPVHELLANINSEDSKIHEAVRKALPAIEALVERIVPLMIRGGRIFYLGAGTSGRLGVLDASEILPTFGVQDRIIGLIAGGETALRRPVEAAEDDPEKAWKELEIFGITEMDTVIGIAASGNTPYVVGGIKIARSRGILTGCITCNPQGAVIEASEYPVIVVVGPEFVTGSTRLKAGTAQKMILNMISTTVMIKLGRVKGNRMINMQLTNRKLVERGIRMIVDELDIQREAAAILLQQHGSVKKAIDYYNKTKGES